MDYQNENAQPAPQSAAPAQPLPPAGQGVDEALFNRLKRQHGGRLRALGLDGLPETDVVVRPPTRLEYTNFKTQAAKSRNNDSAQIRLMEGLVRQCLVWPTKEEFDALLENYPALADSYSEEVMKLAGATDKVSVKNF